MHVVGASTTWLDTVMSFYSASDRHAEHLSSSGNRDCCFQPRICPPCKAR